MLAKKVLICDDSEGILDMLTLVLEDDFNVIAEQDSLNIYTLIEKEKPDLIVLDRWMPVLSGDFILKNLKKIQTSPAFLYWLFLRTPTAETYR